MKVPPCYIHGMGMINALGANATEVASGLAGASPLAHHALTLHDGRRVCVGAVTDALPALPAALMRHSTRNNRLLLAALRQIEGEIAAAIARFGAERVAVVMGTSTSGIDEGTMALAAAQGGAPLPTGYAYPQQELGAPAHFVSALTGCLGPAYTVSTACSSSARAFISAQHLLLSGLADAVIVGGADTLCGLTLNGFYSLESLAAGICTPFAAQRDGINIGEAAAVCLLTREPAAVALIGAGESSDAYHISAPDPTGNGAAAAMQMALQQAQMAAADVGYINLHGTGTRLNDAMEAKAVYRLFGDRVPCSSTKPLTGHTLGAAGITEAAIAWLLLTGQALLPAQWPPAMQRDPQLEPVNLLAQGQPLLRPAVLSNSFAFGGNNVSLLFAREPVA